MIQNRLNDKEKDIQGLKKQTSSLLNCAWDKGYVAGFDDGYKTGRKAEERPTGWIPITEKLPEEDGQYLITVKYKHVDDRYEDIYAEHGEWSDGRWDMFCFGHCGEVEDIIAWMPLPEPYKRGEV